jgi:hypothetical protein
MWESGSIGPPFLSSELDGGEWSASRYCCFTPRDRAPVTHWIGGWVGPRADLDIMAFTLIANISTQNTVHFLLLQI